MCEVAVVVAQVPVYRPINFTENLIWEIYYCSKRAATAIISGNKIHGESQLKGTL